MESVEKLSIRRVKKIKPKIMIYNVHKEDTKEKIMGTILDNGVFLQTFQTAGNKTELIFNKPAAGGTMHYI